MTATSSRARPAGTGTLPTISGHHDALDGIRGLAAMMVLLVHITANTGYQTGKGALSGAISAGAVSVPLFFTLSGLLLYRPWARELLEGRPRSPGYLRGRVLRVMPGYWLVVAYVMVFVLRSHTGDPWTWLKLSTLTFTYDTHPWWVNPLGPEGMGQMWSLTVEVAWYLLLPPTAFLLGRLARRAGRNVHLRARRLLLLIGIYGAVSFVFTIFMFHPSYSPAAGMWLPHYLAWFAVGMALAVLSVWAHADNSPVRRFCRTVGESWGVCWAIAAVLFCIAGTPVTGPAVFGTLDTLWTAEIRVLVYGLFALFFVAPVALAPAGHPVIGAVLANPVMRFLGRISYGVFLWQMVVVIGWFNITGRPAFSHDFLLAFPSITLVTIGLGVASLYAVELPAMRLRRRKPA